jgi:branched-chain amino acid transport system permease protein
VILVRDSLGPSLDGHGPLVLGLVFIAVVFAMPRGVAGLSGVRRVPIAWPGARRRSEGKARGE